MANLRLARYRHGRLVRTETLDELASGARRPGEVVWAWLGDAEPEDLGRLERLWHLPGRSLSDLADAAEQLGSQGVGSRLLLRLPHRSGGRFEPTQLAVLVGEDFVVTTAIDPEADRAAVIEKVEARPDLLALRAGCVACRLLLGATAAELDWGERLHGRAMAMGDVANEPDGRRREDPGAACASPGIGSEHSPGSTSGLPTG